MTLIQERDDTTLEAWPGAVQFVRRPAFWWSSLGLRSSHLRMRFSPGTNVPWTDEPSGEHIPFPHVLKAKERKLCRRPLEAVTIRTRKCLPRLI